MQEVLFVIFLMLSVFMILLSIEYRKNMFWVTVFSMSSIILLYTLSASIMDIERPYEMYNATSGFIETGYHTFRSPVSPYISYFFQFLAIVMLLYWFGLVLIPGLGNMLRKYRII